MQTFDTSGAQRFGSYRLVARLGVGSMAEVFKAYFEGAGGFAKTVALKVYRRELSDDPEFAPSFISEARLGGYLTHDNIVASLDFGRHESRLYLAMEYVRGPSLQKVVRHLSNARSEMPLDIALQIVMQVCRGLEYAHRATDHPGRLLRMVHRDLKPSNILIAPVGTVKIADFGVARAESNAERTMVPTLKGTLRYMSPEQARGSASLDHRSDLFAVGLILFELLTLEHVYNGSSLNAVLEAAKEARVGDRLALLRATPEHAAAIDLLRRALCKDPDRRFASGGQMADALMALRAQLARPLDLRSWLAEHQLVAAADRSAGAPGALPRVTRPQPGSAMPGVPPTLPAQSTAPGTVPSPPEPRGTADATSGQAGDPKCQGRLRSEPTATAGREADGDSVSWVATQRLAPGPGLRDAPGDGENQSLPAEDLLSTQHEPRHAGAVADADPDETRMDPVSQATVTGDDHRPRASVQPRTTGDDTPGDASGTTTGAAPPAEVEPTRWTKDPFLGVLPDGMPHAAPTAQDRRPTPGMADTTAPLHRTTADSALPAPAARPAAPPSRPVPPVSHSEPTRSAPSSRLPTAPIDDLDDSEVDLGTILSPVGQARDPAGGDETRKLTRSADLPSANGQGHRAGNHQHEPTVVLPERRVSPPPPGVTGHATTGHGGRGGFDDTTRRLPPRLDSAQRPIRTQQADFEGVRPDATPGEGMPPAGQAAAPRGSRSGRRRTIRMLAGILILGTGSVAGYRFLTTPIQAVTGGDAREQSAAPGKSEQGREAPAVELPREIPPDQIGIPAANNGTGQVAFRGLRDTSTRPEGPGDKLPSGPGQAAGTPDPTMAYLDLESRPTARYFLDENPLMGRGTGPHAVSTGEHVVTFYFSGGYLLEAHFQADPGDRIRCSANWEAQTAVCEPEQP